MHAAIRLPFVSLLLLFRVRPPATLLELITGKPNGHGMVISTLIPALGAGLCIVVDGHAYPIATEIDLTDVIPFVTALPNFYSKPVTITVVAKSKQQTCRHS
jgi:hypothetical protein